MRAKIAEMKAKHNKFVQENGFRLETVPRVVFTGRQSAGSFKETLLLSVTDELDEIVVGPNPLPHDRDMLCNVQVQLLHI